MAAISVMQIDEVTYDIMDGEGDIIVTLTYVDGDGEWELDVGEKGIVAF